MLRLRDERAMPRLIYLDGNLYLVSTSLLHEHTKIQLGHLVVEIAVGLDIPFRMAGQTTLRHRKKRVGVEGDDTFYLANHARIRGKQEIDLRRDPPPDLMIEAVNTHASWAAITAYRRLGVPEVWVCFKKKLRILALQYNGRYAKVPTSVAFPFLTADEIYSWVSRPQIDSETEWCLAVRRWVAETLMPRVGTTGTGSP
jgi:Uma2 family endonuclease